MRRPTIWASPRPDKNLNSDDAFLAVAAVLITFGMVVNLKSICGYNLPFVIALELRVMLPSYMLLLTGAWMAMD